MGRQKRARRAFPCHLQQPEAEPTTTGMVFSDDPLPPRAEHSGPPSDEPSLELRLATEWPAVCSSERRRLHGDVVIYSGSGREQHGTDLACVIDVSSSMSGKKLNQVKRSLEFVVGELGERDRLTVITFSNSARQVFPLTLMTESGRNRALIACRAIQANGGTSVGQGLLVASRILKNRNFTNDLSVVLLMSDGQSEDYGDAKLMLSDPLQHLPADVSLFTFGYGDDHDARLLANVASVGGGTFFFVHTITSFPAQLADCLGSIMGVAFAHLLIRISTDGNAVVHNIHVPQTWHDADGCTHAKVGTLASGMERDVLFEFELLPQDPGQASVTVEVSAGETHVKKCLTIERPAVLDHCDPDPRVLTQVARIAVASALPLAEQEASEGKLRSAQQRLQTLQAQIAASPVASTSIVQGLLTSLNVCQQGFASAQAFHSFGQAQALSVGSMHFHQQASPMTPCYQTHRQTELSLRSENYSMLPTRKNSNRHLFSSGDPI